MPRRAHRSWMAVTVVLSLLAVAFGYPAFHRKFGFPLALLWMAVVVGLIWLNYGVRVWFFRDRFKPFDSPDETDEL